jgi:hypothetical protein
MALRSPAGRSCRPLTIGWSDRGSRLRLAEEGVDDWDQVPSFDAGEAPRRSTSSLEPYEPPYICNPPPDTADRRGYHLLGHCVLRVALHCRVGARTPSVFAKFRALGGRGGVGRFSPDVLVDCDSGGHHCAFPLESQPLRASLYGGAMAHHSQFCYILMYPASSVVRTSRYSLDNVPFALWWGSISCAMAKLA